MSALFKIRLCVLMCTCVCVCVPDYRFYSTGSLNDKMYVFAWSLISLHGVFKWQEVVNILVTSETPLGSRDHQRPTKQMLCPWQSHCQCSWGCDETVQRHHHSHHLAFLLAAAPSAWKTSGIVHALACKRTAVKGLLTLSLISSQLFFIFLS